MSEQQTAEATATESEATTKTEAETKPTETVEFWKAKAREQEKRAKDEGYKARLARLSTPRLFDQYKAGAKRAKAAN